MIPSYRLSYSMLQHKLLRRNIWGVRDLWVELCIDPGI
jgi:hypothetical protein